MLPVNTSFQKGRIQNIGLKFENATFKNSHYRTMIGIMCSTCNGIANWNYAKHATGD